MFSIKCIYSQINGLNKWRFRLVSIWISDAVMSCARVSCVVFVVFPDGISPTHAPDPADAKNWWKKLLEPWEKIGSAVAPLSIAARTKASSKCWKEDIGDEEVKAHAWWALDHGSSTAHLWCGFLCWGLDDNGGSCNWLDLLNDDWLHFNGVNFLM